MPKHFTSRTDMIEWLIDNCPRQTIVRALQANDVEFLGGFTKIPPSNLPGWIFVIRMASSVKILCILCNDLKHKYEIRIVKNIPWENWHGIFHGILMKIGLHAGDDPHKYKEYWNAAQSNRSLADS